MTHDAQILAAAILSGCPDSSDPILLSALRRERRRHARQKARRRCRRNQS